MPEPRTTQGDFPAYKTVRVADLIPYARNARTHSQKQIHQCVTARSSSSLKASIALLSSRMKASSRWARQMNIGRPGL